MTANNTPAPAQQALLTDDEINDICERPAYDTTMRAENDRALARATEQALLSKLRTPVAGERSLRQALERIADPRNTHFAGDAQVVARAALASAPVAGEAQPVAITTRCPSGILSMDGASLHMQRDGGVQIVIAEDDFTLEDDRSEGPDGPQGGVHWVARLPASEVAALRDFLTGHARPSDDALWDQTLTERDEYHDMADKLANAIADHLLVEIGEHSSSNCPWMRALEAIENAAPQASEAVRVQALAALQSAQRFIRNGVEFGYVRMPDADTPDPAHRTPGLIEAAIRALSSQRGAQKNGGSDAE